LSVTLLKTSWPRSTVLNRILNGTENSNSISQIRFHG
jgi:hypothetical protein